MVREQEIALRVELQRAARAGSASHTLGQATCGMAGTSERFGWFLAFTGMLSCSVSTGRMSMIPLSRCAAATLGGASSQAGLAVSKSFMDIDVHESSQTESGLVVC